jgi:3-methyladenine DNA glycosylase AlkD
VTPERPRPTRRQLERELVSLADPQRAKNAAWFFKTGRGQYGEGDRFLGIPVPLQRKIALRYRELALDDIAHLLASPFHEHRFTALEILVAQYERAEDGLREEIFLFYLEHTSGINNWDLVDTSAPYIVGEHLKTRPRRLLAKLASSANLWERRIAIVSTLALVKHGEIEDTLSIASKLLVDKHDLIHKAVGWALREAGRVSRPALVGFLAKHYSSIPRTALRYAIEHFPPDQRKRILAGNVR